MMYSCRVLQHGLFPFGECLLESETSVFKEMDVEVDAEMEKYDDDGDWGRIICRNKVSALMNEKRRQ